MRERTARSEHAEGRDRDVLWSGEGDAIRSRSVNSGIRALAYACPGPAWCGTESEEAMERGAQGSAALCRQSEK